MTAIAYLRRRTVIRAGRAYLRWVGRAVGWYTVAYLLFWVVVFVIAGVQSLPVRGAPSGLPVGAALGGLVALAFAGLLLVGATPPVVLDRRDLLRLGLAPVAPAAALGLRLAERRATRAALGAAAGLVWTLAAPALLGLDAPWAAPALALLAVAHADLAWLRYAGRRRHDASGRAARGAAAVGIAGVVALGVAGVWAGAAAGPLAGGLVAALVGAGPWSLLAPGALALAAFLAVRRSLALVWPPRFAAQSLVLTQLQALRTLRLLAGIAGMTSGSEAEAGERARLLAALHDRPGVGRPSRSLRPPALGRPAWRALAWRAASAWWRRPGLSHAGIALLVLAAAAAAWGVAPSLAGPAAAAVVAPGVPAPVPPPDPLGAALVAALAVLAAAWLWARAGAALIGPDLPRGTVPVDAASRTRGRLWVPTIGLALATAVVAASAAPVAAWLASLGAWPAQGAAAPAGPDAIAAGLALAALGLTVLVVLEKYASWSGTSPRGWEPTLVAALVATAPTLVLALFGVPGAALPLQLLLLALVWWLPL